MSTDGNGRNGVLMKWLVGLCVALSASAIGGGIKMYGDVRELQKATDLERRVTVLEGLANSINTDRNQRTIILQELTRRVESLERKR